MDDSYDCIVMGGGPAGSTVAALVAMAGHRTLLVEREKFPRFHVGESLMPESYWVFERLGVLGEMQKSSFVRKVSVQFVSHSGKQSQPFDFRQHDSRECSQTWQVERKAFDQLLFDNASKQGAECRDQTRVMDVALDDDRAKRIKIQTRSGETRSLSCRVLVDATGQQSLIATRLGLRRVNPDLRKSAIWGYYQGAERDPGAHGGATVILSTKDQTAWFWYIPLQDDTVSVGVVGDTDYLLQGRGGPEEVFEEELVNCPAVTERLADARLVSKFHVAKEFSYTTDRAAGDGWVLVGDAWGFIDPIYSSGVFFALKSGELAADAIIEGLAAGDTSADRLGGWSDEFSKSTQWIRRLVGAFYTKDFSFGRFMKAYPQHVGSLTDLLIGRIFQPDAGKIFNDMQPWLDAASGQQAEQGTARSTGTVARR